MQHHGSRGGHFRSVVSCKPNGFLSLHSKFGNGERTSERIAAATWNYKDLARHNLLAYRNAAEFATRLWKERGIVWEEQTGSIKRKKPITL